MRARELARHWIDCVPALGGWDTLASFYRFAAPSPVLSTGAKARPRLSSEHPVSLGDPRWRKWKRVI